MRRRLLSGVLKALGKYGAMPSLGLLGLYLSPDVQPLVGVEEGVLRDLTVTYLSASIAFVLRDVREEFEAWRIRRAYGRRVVSFEEYVGRVRRLAEGPYGAKYGRLAERLGVRVGGRVVYLDGFADHVFDLNTRLRDVVLEPSRCGGGCDWFRLIEWLLEPYRRVLEDLFLKAPVWNELKPRLLGVGAGGIEVEPVPYYYTFVIHYSPDINLPGRHRGRTLRSLIEPMLIEDDGRLVPVSKYKRLPVPASLGVNMLLVACNDDPPRMILPRRGAYVAIAPNTYSMSVAGSIDWKTVAGTSRAGLDTVLVQELGEADEASPGLASYRRILPLGVVRSAWLLGKPELYLVGFASINSDPESVRGFVRFGRYEENTTYKAVPLDGGGLNSCTRTDPSDEKTCIDICRVYRSLLRFIIDEGGKAGTNLHLMIVVLSVFLSEHCNSCKGISGDEAATLAISDIVAKRRV